MTAHGSTEHAGHRAGTGMDTPSGRALTAVALGRLRDLRQVLEAHGEDALRLVQTPGGETMSALSIAARNGDSGAAAMLIGHGAQTDHRAGGRMTKSVLVEAIGSRSLSTVRVLLDAGAQPNGSEDICDLAIELGDPVLDPENRILDLVLAHIGATTDTDEALHRAAERGAPEWAALLAAHGADPNHLSPRTGARALTPVLKHRTPHRRDHAYENGWRDYDTSAPGPRLLKVMLDAGVDLRKPLHNNGTYPDAALVAAVEYGAAWAIPTLIKAGADAAPAREEIRRHGVRKGSPHAMLALFA